MRMTFNRTGACVLGGLVLLVALHESVAAPPAEAGRPVAIVLGRKIPRSALTQGKETLQSQHALQRLQELVLGPLLDAYARRKGLEPTKQELQAFNAALFSDMERELAERKEALERKRAELRREDLTDEQRKALQAALESEEQLVRLLAEDVARAPSMPVEDSAVARGMVLAWKTQRALHRQYGGDVIFQQSGPEAVGAYPPFLEERQKAGDFIFLDEELGRRFWEHVRKAPGIRLKEPDVLETPWWLKEPKR